MDIESALNASTHHLHPQHDDYDYFDDSYNNFNFSAVNYTDATHTIWVRKPVWEVFIKTMAVLPIMTIGIFGNLAIVCLILRLKSLRKSHINLFILNMALADLLTTLFCPWMGLVDNVYQNYELGPVFCKLEGFLKMLCLLASVLSLVTVSFDRFIAIVFPFKRHLNRKVSYLIIFAIWAIAIILSSPLAFWRSYRQRQWLDYLEKWCPEDNVETTKFYWLFLMLPLVYLPLFVMIVVYSVIIRHMDKYEKTISINETPVRIKHSQTLIKMLFLYILTTIICWFPLQAVVFYRRFKSPVTELPFWYLDCCFLAQLFASANSAMNPIITFRKSFAHLLPKLISPKKTTAQRMVPMDVAIIQCQLDMAHPSLATASAEKQRQLMLANISNGLNTNTTSFTKQILMKRVPQIFLRDDT
ncbi:neuropeptide FF receptor 2-like [Oppia nitens]|uniref:neuropeptide FF receptor 2-like n=1 Tax=Oppia nitens TaxID=1686743 RepID=UPI0023DA410F|nr:neuropeptide FF receptor 2-like [Oppia nitens]